MIRYTLILMMTMIMLLLPINQNKVGPPYICCQIHATYHSLPMIIDPDRHERLTNDHLLYDPMGDEKDEAWVAEQITSKCSSPLCHTLSHLLSFLETAPKSSQKDQQARTDALLSCPMCFSPLCYSCQR